MTGAGLDRLFARGELLIVIGEAVAVVITIVEAIRRDPKDRVLLFEFLAFVTFFLGLFFGKLASFVWPAVVIWLTLFFGFAFAAAYFALINWLRRTKGAS